MVHTSFLRMLSSAEAAGASPLHASSAEWSRKEVDGEQQTGGVSGNRELIPARSEGKHEPPLSLKAGREKTCTLTPAELLKSYGWGAWVA